MKTTLPTAAALLAIAAPATLHAAPDDDDTASATSPAEAPAERASAATPGARVFSPADFARFSPRNALDMVDQVPGFQIREGDGDQRGLGAANANVLINGDRLPSKSESVRDQLARIPAASIVRLELVDASALAVPGLAGQVVNIVTGGEDTFSGQFRWDATARAHYAKASLLGGEVSLKGKSGAFEYTASLANDPGRGAVGGTYYVYDGAGTVTESRYDVVSARGENPKASVGLTYAGPGSAVGHLNASYRRNFFALTDDEMRSPLADDRYLHLVELRDRGYDYEISGDYDFALGPGRMKLIGLERYRRATLTQTATDDWFGARPLEGGRYRHTVGSGEHIARAEYSWKLGKADLQLAGEAAFNRYAKDASLFDANPDGSFTERPFPEGDGGVTEDRYDLVLTAGMPVTTKLTVQTGIGWEFSRIAQTGSANVTRSFWRPKGSVALAWTPGSGIDVNLKVARTVGQLQFEDFLARAFVDNGNANGVNADLVPEQSWETDLTIKKTLGKWGSTQVRLFDRRTRDYIDVIPLEGGGEGRGNIASAKRRGIEWTSTFTLDPMGLRGAKIDLTALVQDSSLLDPVTGTRRQISGLTRRLVDFTFRHDVPGTDWAYGIGLFHRHGLPYYRVYEDGQENEGPVFSGLFVEHKDVFGLTVTARYDNLFGADNHYRRTVYDGPRDGGKVAFVEEGDRRIGPMFRLTVKGDF